MDKRPMEAAALGAIDDFLAAARAGLMERHGKMTADSSARFYSDAQRGETAAAIKAVAIAEKSAEVFRKVYDGEGHGAGAFRAAYGDKEWNPGEGRFPTTDVLRALREGLGKRHAAMQAPKLAARFTEGDREALRAAYTALGSMEKNAAAINKGVLLAASLDPRLSNPDRAAQPGSHPSSAGGPLYVDGGPDAAQKAYIATLDAPGLTAVHAATLAALKGVRDSSARTPAAARAVRLLSAGANVLRGEFKARGLDVPGRGQRDAPAKPRDMGGL